MAGKKVTEADIRDHIYYLHEYHKYRLKDGSVNPEFDKEISGKILDLKDSTDYKHKRAVKFFSAELEEYLKDFIEIEEAVYAAFVPSHKKGKSSPGLVGIINHLANIYNIKNSTNLLVRHTTIEKLSDGGDRSYETHSESIKVKEKSVKPESKIILLDDVTTTGNSLEACEDLLYAAGAGLVICIALGQTA